MPELPAAHGVGGGQIAPEAAARLRRRAGIHLRVVSKRESKRTDNAQQPRTARPSVMPQIMRYGQFVVLLQCAAAFIYVITLLVDQFGGKDSTLESDSAAASYVDLGTALFLAVVFGFVTWVAVETLRGRPRSQGAVLLLELILAGVSIYMFRGGVPWLGAATLLTAAFVLFSIFHPATRAFEEEQYAQKRGRA